MTRGNEKYRKPKTPITLNSSEAFDCLGEMRAQTEPSTPNPSKKNALDYDALSCIYEHL